jgi:hypothetical protein
MTDNELIDQIQAIRSKNNKCWMDIMRVAMRNAPEETKALLAMIQENDLAISALNGKLAGL